MAAAQATKQSKAVDTDDDDDKTQDSMRGLQQLMLTTPPSVERADALHAMADACLKTSGADNGRTRDALRLYECAHSMRRALFDVFHPSIPRTLLCIGECHDALGHLPLALKYKRMACELSAHIHDPRTQQQQQPQQQSSVDNATHPEVAQALDSLARTHWKVGDETRARDLFDQSLRVYERSLDRAQQQQQPSTPANAVGTGRSAFARHITDVAEFYDKRGQYGVALVYYERALLVAKQTAYSDSNKTTAGAAAVDAAQLHCRVGVAKDRLGDPAAGIRELECALEALDASEFAATTADSFVPRRHHQLLDEERARRRATYWNCMAVCAERLGDVSRSLALKRRAYDARKKLQLVTTAVNDNDNDDDGDGDKDHDAVVDSMHSLALAHEEAGELRKALELKLDMLQMRRRSWQQQSQSQKRETSSRSDYRRPMERSSEPLVSALNDVAVSLEKLGEYAQASAYLTEALELAERTIVVDGRRRALPAAHVAAVSAPLADHALCASVLHNLAVCAQKMGKHAEALMLHTRAFEMRKRLFGSGIRGAGAAAPAAAAAANDDAIKPHPDLAHSLAALAIVHDQLGETERALVYARRALAMRLELHAPSSGEGSGAHANTADALFNLAVLYDKLGDTVRAQHHYERALSMRSWLLERTHLRSRDDLFAEPILSAESLRLNR